MCIVAAKNVISPYTAVITIKQKGFFKLLFYIVASHEMFVIYETSNYD